MPMFAIIAGTALVTSIAQGIAARYAHKKVFEAMASMAEQNPELLAQLLRNMCDWKKDATTPTTQTYKGEVHEYRS